MLDIQMQNLEETCLQDLFIAQAAKTPDAIAVVDGYGHELTYRELDAVTSSLAIQLLEEYDVGPDSVVGILLPRSVQYVISYVAILKAGGAYMPLELVYPKPLLERAVLETSAKCVLTNATYANRIDGQPHVILQAEAPFVDYSATCTLQYPPPSYVHPKPDDLAFCVMSSGTTGSPKGICQTHRAAVHSYMDRFTRFPYHTDPTTGQVDDRVGAGVFFVWEMFRPLCQGATVVVIPDHVLFDPQAVTTFLQTHAITRLLVTPSLMQLILDTMDRQTLQERLAGLRYFWFCGEVVSRDLAHGLLQVCRPDIELMNLYSISECHDVSIGDLKRELDPARKYATCGQAIPGVTFYIVDLEDEDEDDDLEDEDGSTTNNKKAIINSADDTTSMSTSTSTLKQVPRGEKGEVYVGGPVVGRGYLNMPEKTAERFVPNPFPTDQPNCTRLYKTGDLGRLLPNGQLEILGRCDFMVKIRGYSVVLGAIETALAKHPKLSSSVVLAVGSEGSRDKKLVAYVVPTNWHDAPSAKSVRAFLKEHLPPYAIPSTFCVIDALPVAASAAGKLDRKKLPSHETARRLRAFSEDLTNILDGAADQATTITTTTQRLAPENETEQVLLETWAELLQLSTAELSALDNFFEVGGHSLLATRMVASVNAKLGLMTTDTSTSKALTIVAVMEEPTLRGMADHIRNQQNGNGVVKPKIDLQAEASALDPSIYPYPTRKGNTMSRFRLEASALMSPRVVFLTGATGYLGAHILAELLHSPQGVTVIALARAGSDEGAKDRLVKTLRKYHLLEGLSQQQNSATTDPDQENQPPENDTDHESVIDTQLVAIAGDLSKPLLGLDNLKFKALAVEIDSIIHCGAQVNLVKPYTSLKASNVFGTQEILRLATTNGFIKTKVKPVHYISTNGIFPVETEAYPSLPICVKEDVSLDDLSPHLREGYVMTKWVAERMCTIAESRGLPVSILRPGNMAGSSTTGIQNPDDLNYLLMQGMIAAKCAPVVDTNYALDLTPVDFAARAVVHLAVQAPHKAMGQRFHLQNPQKPVPLTQVVEWLQGLGYELEAVTEAEWTQRLTSVAQAEQLASGWASFTPYFEASTWLQYGSANLQQALSNGPAAGDDQAESCPVLSAELLQKWFPIGNK